ERMFSFKKDGDGYNIEMTLDEQKQLIFGIRPCDAKGIAMIDKVFTETYEDPYYVSKRKNTVLIGLSCTNPYDSCFCTSLGLKPTESADVDLMFTDIGDEFLIEEITDKGEKLLETASLVKQATKTDDAKAKTVKAAVSDMVIKKVDTKEIANKLQACFSDKAYWEKVATKCISCGVCTFLCPTCFCFDICDELVKKKGARYRGWDSCSFRLYTRMPVENPREEKWRRVRQRVCHKYEFYPMNFNVTACTGCGRCIRLCPVNWDISQILKSLPTSATSRSEK
ncbi:MAG: 4Fe-4S dicluster domain-containing protein, partial [Dehalococcoidales bacterium]|nr:4Fe-4S dicluster domain-containing protein [Dehalococcoidales bacterium]